MGTTLKFNVRKKISRKRKTRRFRKRSNRSKLKVKRARKILRIDNRKSDSVKMIEPAPFRQSNSFITRRTSLRIQNKYVNNQNNVLDVLDNLKKSDLVPSPLEDTWNVNRQNSDDSVIYVNTTYFSGSKQNIPTIDLTESNSSIASTKFAHHSVSSTQQIYDGGRFKLRKRKFSGRSLSLVTLKRVCSSETENSAVSESGSTVNLDRSCLDNPTFCSEPFWELRKSYALTAHFHSIADSTLLRSNGQENFQANEVNDDIIHDADATTQNTAAKEGTLCNDLEDLTIIPLLKGALKDIELDALASIYEINEPNDYDK